MSLMKSFRDNIKVIFFIVIVGFLFSIFAGLGSYFFRVNKDIALKINNKKISQQEFEDYFNNLKNRKLSENKDLNSPINEKEIKEEALRNIVQDNLLLQESIKVGEVISDSEIKSLIMRYPIFQNKGKFDSNLYYKNLRYIIRKNPDQFEKTIGNNIKIDKLKFLMMSSVKVSSNEILIEYNTSILTSTDIKQEDFYKQYPYSKSISLMNDWFKSIVGKSKTEVFLK